MVALKKINDVFLYLVNQYWMADDRNLLHTGKNTIKGKSEIHLTILQTEFPTISLSRISRSAPNRPFLFNMRCKAKL